MKEINEITGAIIDASLKIHKKLGPGLFESIYEELLCYELNVRGLKTERQVSLPVYYDDIRMDVAFRADIMVEGVMLVEVKSIEIVAPVHKKQLLTYLRLANLQTGLLINFNESLLKNGITRLFNNHSV
jgi:GxxExxY protein